MTIDPLERHNGGGRRFFVTTAADLAALSRVLKAAFPDIAIYTHTPLYHRGERIDVRLWDSIEAADDSPVTIKFPPPGWRPEFERAPDPGSSDGWGWRLKVRPAGPTLFVYPSHPPQNKPERYHPNPPWHIYPGDFVISLNVRNPEHARMKAKLYRLMGKVATNRMRLVEWPSMRDLGKGLPLWVGFDALRWQREAPGRVFAFKAGASGRVTAYVPAD